MQVGTALAPTGAVSAAPETPPLASAPVRVLVRFADPAGRDATLRRHAAVSRGPVGKTGFEVLELPASSARDAAEALRAEPGVGDAEPDARLSIFFTPNDPFFLTDPYTPGHVGQWGLRVTHVDAAWDLQKGVPAVVVAAIDTGVDASHADLQGVLVDAPRYVSAADASCAADTTNKDDNGHGTHVVGIIGANGNNAVGIVGAAFGVKVMPIKALDCTGAGLLSDIASALTYAADHGARVINISLGSAEPSAALASAIAYATSKNALVIAAAGNCGNESGTSRCPTMNVPDYPAAYPGVLAVGATDANDEPAAFSTQGSYIGISAPGTSILSTFPTYAVQLNGVGVASSGYAVLRGTSQASPLVAGIAALVLSQDPSLAPAALAERLRANADDLGAAGWDLRTGDGRVNALRALSASKTPRYGARYQLKAAPSTLAFASVATLRTVITNASTFVWRASGTNPVRVASHWYAADGTLVIWDGPRYVFGADVAPGTSVPVDVPLVAPVPKGGYVLKVDVVEEGVTWFSSRGVEPLILNVRVGTGRDATFQASSVQLSADRARAGGLSLALTLVVTNAGARTWSAAGTNPVHLATHVRALDGGLILWDGQRAILGGDVAPGAATTVVVSVPLPASPGAIQVELDLVEEGVSWFADDGVAASRLGIVLGPIAAVDEAALPPENEALASVSARGALALGATNTRLAVYIPRRSLARGPLANAAYVIRVDPTAELGAATHGSLTVTTPLVADRRATP